MARQYSLLDLAAQSARQYLDPIGERPVHATRSSADLYRALAVPPTDTGDDPRRVIESLAAAGRDGTVATQGPRYFGRRQSGARAPRRRHRPRRFDFHRRAQVAERAV